MDRRRIGAALAALSALAALLATRAEDEDPKLAALSRERKENELAWTRAAEATQKRHAKKWAAVVQGKVLVPFDGLDAAREAADKTAPGAKHRFLFEVGEDEKDVELSLSPFDGVPGRIQPGMPDDALQIGTGLKKRLKVKESLDESDTGTDTVVWERAGKKRIWRSPDGPRATLALACVGSEKKRDLELRTSDVFSGDLTLHDELARALGLDRFALPGKATCGKLEYRKVRVRVIVPELGVDELAVAFVDPPPSAEEKE